MYAQRRLKSACASAQTDQSLRSPDEESLQPWLFQMRPIKILIKVLECSGLSGFLMGARVRKYVFWSNDKTMQ